MVNSFQLDLIKQKIKNLGDVPGCYLWKDEDGSIIYIGKALRLQDRVRSYLYVNITDIKTISLQNEIYDLDWIVTNTEEEALILEASLIKKFFPKYNVRLKDDKRYPYICISTDEMYPMVYITRKVKNDNKKYFGPYTDVKACRELLNFILKIFPIRKTQIKLPSSKPLRPCLNFHIKRCLGPCMGTVEIEDYSTIVSQVIKFLEGKKEDLITDLKKNMLDLSEKMQFERASIYRDMINSITLLNKKQNVVLSTQDNEDILAIARRDDTAQIIIFEVREGRLEGKKSFALEGVKNSSDIDIYISFLKLYYINNNIIPNYIKIPFKNNLEIESIQTYIRKTYNIKLYIKNSNNKKDKGLYNLALKNAELNLTERLLATKLKSNNEALNNLKEILNLNKVPDIIECYDISHFQGSEPVGSGVMFVDGMPYKNGYRRYKIKSYLGINDPGMIHEVISRRFQRLLNSESVLPDLVVIDGGYTQLSRAVEALLALEIKNLPIIGLAKKREEIYFPGEKNPYSFPVNLPGIRLIRQLRDEAHRFGVEYHRLRRNKSTMNSVLDNIENIGKIRKNAIFKILSQKKKLKEFTMEDLRQVPGISEKLANTIYNSLKSHS